MMLQKVLTGGIGLDARELETKLQQYFRRAERWKAIVLIDEADIYLEKRGSGDTIEKHAVVAGEDHPHETLEPAFTEPGSLPSDT